ncbi:hypothetical protein PVAP13_8KG210508 [Panicum virgatum]|uniref:Class II aldolase/adducin N-terminal domain-containing protein n=1 Tax=Panicum virgatum TaxID=38727 RepID=A0A8T0PSK4_PANVG|nr:hypothetical protein PVAP13_8KG210508 [Panicum virgatum]
MSPSGVQKERMVAEDMYVMAADGKVLSAPTAKPWPNKPPKCTDCAPLFMKAYLMRGAGAVIHSHGMETCIATMLNPGAKEFRMTHMEMIKGIKGHGYRDELVIPIIENTPYEYELTDSLSEAIAAYPKATAVLVQTKEDFNLLRIQIEDDLRNGIAGAVPVPPDEAGKEEVINSLVANVESMIKADRKITSLKQLQGHIWRTGFENKELHGVVFEDVPVALKNWHASGIKVYIYSSGSREAQRLLFGNTMFGDLRKFLCGYFDTTTGNKRETKSYFEISQSLGVDSPSQILFITDVYQEAIAAKNAGFDVIISIRPGNAPLPENHGFRTIKSFSEI